MSTALPRTSTRGFLSGLAALTAVSLALVLAPSPAMATNLLEAENLNAVTSAVQPGFVAVEGRVPAVESAVGRGSALAGDAAGTVALGDSAADHTAALVRITVSATEADTTVFTGQDTAVLHARTGQTASTTVLLPVVEEAVPLWADHLVNVRIEPLAYFSGTTAAPGATIALPKPVIRANTAQQLGGSELSETPLWIGLTGDGDIAGALARSVYVTLDVQLHHADRVTLGDGQVIELPAGRSIVSTVVAPDAQGGVQLSLETPGNSGQLRADVLGWVTEAPEDTSSANLNGSYVVNTDPADRQELSVRADGDAAEVRLAEAQDVDYALVLVDASTQGQVDTTTLAWEAAPTGRASGVAVDRAAGSAPQLELVPVSDGHAELSIRRGAAQVAVDPLGGFLGGPAGYDAASPATIEITAPRELAAIDLSESGYFVLEGTASAGANAIDRVEISSPGVGFIGLAELNYQGAQLTWTFRALAPDDGDFDYVATVYDRSDRGVPRAEDRVRLEIDAADESDTVVSPEARIFNANPEQPEFRVIDESTVAFAERPDLEPGDVIVSGPTADAPSGFLGRMSHMDLVDGVWTVTTTIAELSDVFLQVDVEQRVDYAEGTGVEVHDVAATTTDASVLTGTYAPIDESGAVGPEAAVDDYSVVTGTDALVAGDHARLNTGDAVDLTLGADDFAELDPADFETQCRAAGSDQQEPTGDQIDENGEWVAPVSATPAPASACGLQDGLGVDVHGSWSVGVDAGIIFEVKNGKPRIKNATALEPWEFDAEEERTLENKAAIAIRASGELAVSLDFVLKVKMKWKWKVIPKGIDVKEFSVQLVSATKAKAALKASFEVGGKLNFGLQVAEVALPTTLFFIGPVPVAITNQLNFAVAVTGELKAEVAIPAVGIQRTDRFGFSYSSSGGMKRIKNDVPTKYVVPQLDKLKERTSLSLSGGIAVGPEMSYQSRIYSFAGPDLALSGKAGVEGEAEASLADPRAIEAKVEVYIEAGLTGKAKLTLLRWDLVNLNIFSLTFRVNLFTKEWEFRI